MAIADIERWLAGNKDFAIGKKIYLHYGKDETFKKQLSFPVTSFLKRKLLNNLRQLNDAAKVELRQKTLPTPPTQPKAPPSSFERPKFNEKDLSPFLKTRNQLKNQLWAELNEYRKLLDYNTSNKEIQENNRLLILKIKSHDKQIDSLWDEINYHLATGEELVLEDEVNLPIHKIQRKRDNARSGRSRYRGKPGKEHLYTKHNNELIRLDQILNAS